MYAEYIESDVCVYMKTTLEVDAELLNRAREVLGSSTIRETVERSLQAVVRQKALHDLADSLGSFDFAVTRQDLKEQRRARPRKRNASR